MLTVFARPLLAKPRPRSAAIANPWTPAVSPISPTAFSVYVSTTATLVPCVT